MAKGGERILQTGRKPGEKWSIADVNVTGKQDPEKRWSGIKGNKEKAAKS